MCHNSEKSGKKVKFLMARKVENFLSNECRGNPGSMPLPFKHLDVSLLASNSSNSLRSREKSLPFAQDSANKVSHVLWLARSSESLGPVIANCHYCKRCYGYGYQDGSNHDVSWMDKPEPGARSYVNLMGC